MSQIGNSGCFGPRAPVPGCDDLVAGLTNMIVRSHRTWLRGNPAHIVIHVHLEAWALHIARGDKYQSCVYSM